MSLLVLLSGARWYGLLGGEGRAAGSSDGVALVYEAIDWMDLIPRDDLDALLSPPDWIDVIEEGSDLDQALLDVEEMIKGMLDGMGVGMAVEGEALEAGRRYFEALRSTRTLPEQVGRAVRIPGFIVPLEFDDAGRIIEFFLVPYFGACLHLPPPPPNQMILGRFAAGFPLPRLEDAFWVEGTLGTAVNEHALGVSAWTLEVGGIRLYDWE
jgi:hypothetical protein